MPRYGLTESQRQNYYSLRTTKINREYIDYVHLFVYDLDDNLINETQLDFDSFFDPDLEGFRTKLSVNIGQHLRDLNYRDGEFRVEYRFYRKIAGDEGTSYFIEIQTGEAYEGDSGSELVRTTTGIITKYFALKSDGTLDYSRELILYTDVYNVFEVSPDRTELIIAPNEQFPDEVKARLLKDLRKINSGTYFIPSKISDTIKDASDIFPSKNTLELPKTDEYDEVFTSNMVGQTIVFENFFRAIVPGHSAGFFFQDWKYSTYGAKMGQRGIEQQPKNSEIILENRDWGDFEELGQQMESGIAGQDNILELPPMLINEQGSRVEDENGTTADAYNFENLTISNTNVADNISNESGYYLAQAVKRRVDSLEHLPKDIWVTNTKGRLQNPIHEQEQTGDEENDSNFLHYEQGMHPYVYDERDDTDNIAMNQSDFTRGGTYIEQIGLVGIDVNDQTDIPFQGYSKYCDMNPLKVASDEYLVHEVLIPLFCTITQVVDETTIKFNTNQIKQQYYDLRHKGFRITSLGNHNNPNNYQPGDIETFKMSDISKIPFYIESDAYNDIGQYRTYLKNNLDFYLVTNLKPNPSGYAIKLHKPLLDNVVDVTGETPSEVSIVEERLQDIKENIVLIPTQEVNDTFLYPANFDSQYNEINNQPTAFQSQDDILSSDTEQNRELERLLVSSSLLDVQPNVDYSKTTTDISTETDDTGFGNFIHFSNAERRLLNFRKKLRLIESYTAESGSLSTVTSTTVVTKREDLSKKRQRVIDSFTPYEDYLYFESSSFSSASNGIFHDTSWPKTNSSSPYILEHSSGSTAETWFNTMVSSASKYDFDNQNSLRNTLPDHVSLDTENNVYLEFMDMVGEQFDETWTYVKSLTDINIRVNNMSEGISKDIARYYSEALGIKLFNGSSLTNLSEYLLGKNTDGTSKNELSGQAISEEIWKRILANLPYFFKTKGTERSIKGILNCYGIPSSILRVREYGGPDKGTRVNYEIKRKFTRALDFRAGQYIKSPYTTLQGKDINGNDKNLYPETMEFRFRTPNSVGSSGSMVLLQKSGSGAGSEGSWAISLQDNGTTDDYGYLRFAISSSNSSTGVDPVQYITSSLNAFYNDDFWSVMLTRKSASDGSAFTEDSIYASSSFELTVKQYDSTRQRIVYQSSESLETGMSSSLAAFTSSGDLYLGGSGTGNHGSQFSGSMMEFRLWSEPLSQSVFNNHVRTPKAYNGNTTSSAYDNLLLRLTLDENRNLNTSPTASNFSHQKTFSLNLSGSSNVNGFTGNFYRTLTDQEKVKVPNVGFRRNATKIRIEDNNLKPGTTLDVNQSNEVSTDDFAPIDSDKVGIYLSPTDVINEDILYSIADFNFDNLIGDPRDQNQLSYRGLKDLRSNYFKRYLGGKNNFFDYLRILEFYDNSLFDIVKQFLPARSKALLGYLIEPNVLHRSKNILSSGIKNENQYYEQADHFQKGMSVTSSLSGEYIIKNSLITSSLYEPSLVHLNEINPRSPKSTTYATASIVNGDTLFTFTETLQPFMVNSRKSTRYQQVELYYTSSLSASTSAGFGENYKYPDNLYVISSSFIPSEFEKMYEDSAANRLFYVGTQLNKFNNTYDEITGGEEPVVINTSRGTELETQELIESRLKTN